MGPNYCRKNQLFSQLDPLWRRRFRFHSFTFFILYFTFLGSFRTKKREKKKIENGDRHRDNLGKSTIFSFRTELQKHAKTVTVTISLLMKTAFSFRTKLWKSTKTVTVKNMETQIGPKMSSCQKRWPWPFFPLPSGFRPEWLFHLDEMKWERWTHIWMISSFYDDRNHIFLCLNVPCPYISPQWHGGNYRWNSGGTDEEPGPWGLRLGRHVRAVPRVQGTPWRK